MNKLLKISLVVVFVLFIGALAFSIINRGNVAQINQKFAAPSFLSSAISDGPNSFLFAGSSSFATYNYVTGQTHSLGPGSDLGNVDSTQVSSNGRYILFHETGAANGSLLTATLQSQKISASPFGYWWVYDTQTQSVHLFANVLLLKFANNSVYSLQQNNNSESISTYSLSDYQLIKTMNVLSSSAFVPISGGIILQTPDNKIYYTTDGTINNLIADNVSLVSASSDGTVVAQHKNSNILVTYDVHNNSSEIISKTVIGKPLWNGSDGILYATGISQTTDDWQLHYYSLATKKIALWSVATNVGTFGSTSLIPVTVFGPNALLANSTSGKYYLVGSGLSSLNITSQ